MKKITYFVNAVLVGLFLINLGFSQELNSIRNQKINEIKQVEEKINQLSAKSKEADEIRKIIESGNKLTAFEKIKKDDESVIQLLEIYADKGVARMIYSEETIRQMPWIIEYHQQSNGDADVALAKLGRTEYLKRILSQTDKSKNILIRYEAIRKLILIDSKESYTKLYELLDDTNEIKSESDDVTFVSIAGFVIGELSKVVDCPPTEKGKFISNEMAVKLWKDWFKRQKLN
jgi:HEAT repeat protein